VKARSEETPREHSADLAPTSNMVLTPYIQTIRTIAVAKAPYVKAKFPMYWR
jgi:hypothetical protein